MLKRFQLPFLALILCITGISCSVERPKNELTFTNDAESIDGWETAYGVEKGISHSGNYSLYTDKDNPYSRTFKMKFRNISDQRVSGAYYSVWCYADKLPVKGLVVLSVKSDQTDNLVYHTTNIEQALTVSGKWVELKGMVRFKGKEANPDNEVGFYIWNQGVNKINADDIRLQFEK